MATKVIGLDFGSRSVKLCESLVTLRTTELIGYDYEDLNTEANQRPSYEQLAEAAQKLLTRRGLLQETILCVPPSHMVSFVEITLPFESTKKIDSVMPFELDDRIPVDVEDVVFDYQVSAQGEGQTTCMVVYARRSELQAFLDALLEVGIDPREVGFGPMVLSGMPRLKERPTETQLIVDLGHHGTQIAVLSGGSLVFARDISMGVSNVLGAYMTAFQVNADEALKGLSEEGTLVPKGDTERERTVHEVCHRGFQPLARELKRTWLSISNQSFQAPQEVLVVGGGSLLHGVSTRLEEDLQASS